MTAITAEVDCVWKGSVPSRIDIHVWQLKGEMPSYGKNERYVVLAKRLTDPRVRTPWASATQTHEHSLRLPAPMCYPRTSDANSVGAA